MAGVGPVRLRAWMGAFHAKVAAAQDELTALDAAIGDGDHGVNMVRGTSAVVAALAGFEDPAVGACAQKIGMTLVSSVGGASGPLYGTFFLRFAAGLGQVPELADDGVAPAFARGLEGLRARGKSLPGDKTMLDALTPAVDQLITGHADGTGLAAALAAAADAAEEGARATIPLLARRGRASYLGERSIGHEDPGAASMALLVRAAAETLAA
jgi:dihydroxyacetone kinase-like protein